jgi:hypothetical protein
LNCNTLRSAFDKEARRLKWNRNAREGEPFCSTQMRVSISYLWQVAQNPFVAFLREPDAPPPDYPRTSS